MNEIGNVSTDLMNLIKGEDKITGTPTTSSAQPNVVSADVDTVKVRKGDGVNVMTVLKLLGIAAIGFYVFKSVTGNGVSYTVNGVTQTRNIFAWFDITIAVVIAFAIIKFGKSVLR